MPPTDLILAPDRYDSVPVYDLLVAAGRGRVGIDHAFLHAIIDNPQRAVLDLVRFAGENHDQEPVDLFPDLISIFREIPVPEALPFLIDAVRDNSSDDLADAIRRQGPPALEPLLSLLDELEGDERGDVLFLIATLGVRDSRILDALLHLLETDPIDAAIMLEAYGDPAARPALQVALNRVPAADRTHMEATVAALAKPHDCDYIEPFDIWSEYPVSAEPIYEVLSEEERIAFLSAGPVEYRLAAAKSFSAEDLTPKATAALVHSAQHDDDATVRGQCWDALGGIQDPTVERLLKNQLKNKNAPVVERAGALTGLAGQAGETDVKPYVLEFYERPETRAKALKAMWGAFDRTYEPYFGRHLDDPDPDIRREAIWGVGYLGIGSEASRLRTFFEDEDLRAPALYAYALAIPAEVSRDEMQGLFQRIETAAGPLSRGETELVQRALDQRLAMNGLDPVFFGEETD